jgi:hypothetical protein
MCRFHFAVIKEKYTSFPRPFRMTTNSFNPPAAAPAESAERKMTQAMQPGRRKALKFLAGAPLLPLGAASTAGLLSACGGSSSSAPVVAPAASFVSATFAAMAAPDLSTPAKMATTTVASALNVTLSDNSTVSYKLSYQPFFTTGDLVDDGKGGKILAGGYFDINNKPIMDKSVAGKERQFFSDSRTAPA